MKRATALPAYRDLQPFAAPAGTIELYIDPETAQLASPSCPVMTKEVFITGTEPHEICQKHYGGFLTSAPPLSWLSGLFNGHDPRPEDPSKIKVVSEAPPAEAPRVAARPEAPASVPPLAPAAKPAEEKKPGIFGRIFGIFGGSKNDRNNPTNASPPPE
jgi:hypothetical protein